MTVFLYEAAQADGDRSAGRIEAASLEAARFRLEEQGLREIVFHTDETNPQRLRALGLNDAAAQVSPEVQLRYLRTPPRGLTFIAKVYAGNWLVWVVPLLWAGWNLWKGPPYTLRGYASFLLAIAGLLFPLWVSIPSRQYNALLEAKAWVRWAEVRRRCAFFRRWGKYFITSVPAFEVAVNDACAVAAGGDLPGALASLEFYERSIQPRALYLGRIASVYTAARDWQGMADCQEEAYRLSQGGTLQSIDYATTLVWRLRDADGAARVLEGVADKERTQLAQSFYDFAQGLIALERGQPAVARDLLHSALHVQRDLHTNPLMQAMADFVLAYLSIALAQSGDKAQARKLLRVSLPRLTAYKDLLLARRCAAAVA